MLLHTKRLALEHKFVEWANENNIEISIETFTSYLTVHGLLNENNIELLLKTQGKDCRDCRYFLGCECFSSTPCRDFKEQNEGITNN